MPKQPTEDELDRLAHLCRKLAGVMREHQVTLQQIRDNPKVARAVFKEMGEQGLSPRKFIGLVQHIQTVLASSWPDEDQYLPGVSRGRRVPRHRSLDEIEEVPGRRTERAR